MSPPIINTRGRSLPAIVAFIRMYNPANHPPPILPGNNRQIFINPQQAAILPTSCTDE